MGGWLDNPYMALALAAGAEELIGALMTQAFLLAAVLTVAGRSQLSSAQKHRLLYMTVLGASVLPLLSLLAPAWDWALWPAISSQSGPVQLTDLSDSLSVGGNASARPFTLLASSRPWQIWLLLIWMAGAVWGVMRFAINLVRQRQFRKKLTSIPPGPMLDNIMIWLREQGALNSLEIRTGDNVKVPCTWGSRRPVLALPPDASSWSRRNLRMAVLHEWAHIRRNDSMRLLITRFAACLFWINPFYWLAQNTLLQWQEKSCDEQVIQWGEKPSAYASMLLNTACRIQRAAPFPAGAATLAAGVLQKRIIQLLSPQKPLKPAGRWAMRISLLTLVLLLMGLATVDLWQRNGLSPGKHWQEMKAAESCFSQYVQGINTRRADMVARCYHDDYYTAHGVSYEDGFKGTIIKVEKGLFERYSELKCEYNLHMLQKSRDGYLAIVDIVGTATLTGGQTVPVEIGRGWLVSLKFSQGRWTIADRYLYSAAGHTEKHDRKV